MQEEHPFAHFIRIIGKGKNGARNLTVDEAFEAMSMVLEDNVTGEQLGAFLMLLRVREESPEEVAGFVRAIRHFLKQEKHAFADLDWSSYAGKRRHSPWYVLSALLLADNGVRVCMHGAEGHTPGRMYTSEVLKPLGIETSTTLEHAKQQIEKNNFCYMPLQTISERLKDIIELRPFLGLRSPIHTVGRMINPLQAPHSIQAIFHPGYQSVHQLAAYILSEDDIAVFKGEAGEVERNPDTKCTVSYAVAGKTWDEEWPPMFERRHMKESSLDDNTLGPFWRGETTNEYAQAAIIGTTAIALRLLNKADTPDDALALAENMWAERNKDRY
ncbi:Anthranilate phosphoribosyltransferase like [hydrothermal vent metagenome]|uniref:Anthranilate phosphoribosyltransferase like n=1 Tax=hydrothermal vent metagenome TaxID=652676 RepID=A0A3B0WZN0_9ZZZZ